MAEIGAMSRDIPYEAKILVKRMRSDPNVDLKRHWKCEYQILLMIKKQNKHKRKHSNIFIFSDHNFNWTKWFLPRFLLSKWSWKISRQSSSWFNRNITHLTWQFTTHYSQCSNATKWVVSQHQIKLIKLIEFYWRRRW